MANLYIALIHYPVLDRRGRTVTSAITGLDLHDIARSARTYGVKRFSVVTPLESQQEIAKRLQAYWLSLSGDDPTHRAEALQDLEIAATLDGSLRRILAEEGLTPLIIATSARRQPKGVICYSDLARQLESGEQPVVLLFGTGWGLAADLLERTDAVLPPICGPGEYNHLSVRAAAAITLDRLRGRREGETHERER